MIKLKRFSVSLDKKLVDQFDDYIHQKNYPTRSKAVGEFIARYLVEEKWPESELVVGAIVLVYNHHKRELVSRLTDIQHDFHQLIVSSQHIHLDRNNCLEMVVTRGKARQTEKLINHLHAVKGISYLTFIPAVVK